MGVVPLRGIEIEGAGAALLRADEQRVDLEDAGPAEDISAAGVGNAKEVGRADDDAVGDGIGAAVLNESSDAADALADIFAISAVRRGTGVAACGRASGGSRQLHRPCRQLSRRHGRSRH